MDRDRKFGHFPLPVQSASAIALVVLFALPYLLTVRENSPPAQSPMQAQGPARAQPGTQIAAKTPTPSNTRAAAPVRSNQRRLPKSTASSPDAVEVRITDHHGSAIAGVQLTLTNAGTSQAVASTGPDGRSTFSLIIDDSATYALRVSADGYQPETHRVELRTDDAGDMAPIEIRLSARDRVAVAGTVTDQFDNPAVGVDVLLFSSDLQSNHHARSASDGRFTFDDVTPGDNYAITVGSDLNFRRLDLRGVDVAADMPELHLRRLAQPVGEVRGTVQTPTADPLAGFSMTLTSSGARSHPFAFTTDDAGRFSLNAIPAGNLRFSTRKQPRLLVRGATLKKSVQLELTLNVDVGPYHFLGQVLDGQGDPVSQAHIELSRRHVVEGLAMSSSRTATTNANGEYSFESLAPANYRVAIRRAGYTPYWTTIPIGTGHNHIQHVLRVE